MGIFGKKQPSEFDVKQDATIQSLMKNQQILVTNNNNFIKQHKDLWSWINKLVADNKALLAKIQALEAESIQNKQRDEAIAQQFKNLASLSTKTETE